MSAPNDPPDAAGPTARTRGVTVRALDLLRLSVVRSPTTSATRPRGEINLQWLIHLRWAAIAGQLTTVLVVNFVLGVEIPVAALLAVIALEFGTNGLLLGLLRDAAARRHREHSSTGEGTLVGPSSQSRLHALQLGITILDTVLLATLLGLTGGTANPFCAFLIIHVALGAVLLPLRHSLVAAVVVGVALVVIELVFSRVPALETDIALRGWGTVVAVALTAVLSVYFVSRVTSALVSRSEQLEEARERRERRRHLEALGTLAAGAAHELGTPLSTIAIVAKELELRLDRGGASVEDVGDARLIRDEVARCRRILGRMSTDTGAGVGEALVPTAVGDLGREVIGELAASSRVRLVLDGVDDGDTVQLPREGLATTIRAIVQNGLDASEPEGVVTLTVGRREDALRVEVRDEGEGMDAEQLERALEPFYTTKDVGRGMGLGLYLASSYVESLGGRIDLESTPGRGTLVRVLLPLKADGPPVGSWGLGPA